MFGSTVGVFGVGRSNGAISLLPNPRWRHSRHLSKIAAILKNSNGDISAAYHPIYSMFGSRMGFSVSEDLMALIPV